MKKKTKKANSPANATEFAKQLIHGPGGFISYENAEVVVFDDRDVSIARWILACLANPDCEYSDKVLKEIMKTRKSGGPAKKANSRLKGLFKK